MEWYFIMEYLDPTRRDFETSRNICSASLKASSKLLLAHIHWIGLKKVLILSQSCPRCRPISDRALCFECKAMYCRCDNDEYTEYTACCVCDIVYCYECMVECISCHNFVGTDCWQWCGMCSDPVCDSCRDDNICRECEGRQQGTH